MAINAIRYKNILPNNFLIDDSERLHPELVSALKFYFEQNFTSICIDFTSITLTSHFNVMIPILLGISANYNVPIFLMPATIFQGRLASSCNQMLKVPIFTISDKGDFRWYGINDEHAHVLQSIMKNNASIDLPTIDNTYNKDIASFLLKEANRPGGYLRIDNDYILPRINCEQLFDFLEEDHKRKIAKALLDYNALSTGSHYHIEESGIHTDTLLNVDNLINESSKAFNKLVTLLSVKISSISNYDFIICGHRLRNIAGLIEGEIGKPVFIVNSDKSGFLKILPYSNSLIPSMIEMPPNSSGIIIDAVCRSGNTISKLAKLVTNCGFRVVSSYAFFSPASNVWINDLHDNCQCLFQVDIQSWASQDSCEICSLGLFPILISSSRECPKYFPEGRHSTPHHFWENIYRTKCMQGESDSHLYDDAGHHFLDYMDIAKLLSIQEVRISIVNHLYANLISHIKNTENSDICIQKIRYILYKDGLGSRILAEQICKLLDGYTCAIPVEPKSVDSMQMDPEHWDKQLLELGEKIKEELVVLVDDGINSGWTIRQFEKYFATLGIKNIATLVVVNRAADNIVFKSPIIDYYHCALPVWHEQIDCPMCLHENLLSELSRMDMPTELLVQIKRVASALEKEKVIRTHES